MRCFLPAVAAVGVALTAGPVMAQVQARAQAPKIWDIKLGSPIKDLPISEQPVVLIFRTPQFHCERCDSYFTPSYGAFAPGAHATERFLAQAAKLIRFSDIANAAAFFGVAESTLTRWYYDYVERQQNAPPATLKPITSIGIDELSLKKSIGSS